MFESIAPASLRGRLLLALPAVRETAFRKGVVLVCAHSTAGAMGLLVNRAAPEGALLRLLGGTTRDVTGIRFAVPVHAGGPAEVGRAFVLHSTEYRLAAQTIDVLPGVSLTPNADVLRDILRGRGPKRSFVAAGYCGWGPGQIEDELRGGSWLTGPALSDLVFSVPCPERWAEGMRRIGVAPAALSMAEGRA
jgi:putative transcriptional regulator